MKKKIILIAPIAIILLILMVPVRMNLKDGGSVRYKALLYEITKIHQLSPVMDGVKPYIDGFEIKILGMRVYRKTNETPQIENALSEGVYIYEKGSFSGIGGDNFIICIRRDGTWSYTEGMASSHMAIPEKCSWVMENEILILTEKRYNDEPMVNYFRVEENCLVYQAEGSSNFIYTKVENGDKFFLDKKDVELKEKFVDKTFVYPNKEGATSDIFTIGINMDGTVWYSESGMLSITHRGNWILKNDVLVIIGKTNDGKYAHNYFKISGNSLIFQADNSDNFNFTKLSDGAVFNIEK